MENLLCMLPRNAVQEGSQEDLEKFSNHELTNFLSVEQQGAEALCPEIYW